MPSAGPPAAQGLTTITGRFGQGSAAMLILVNPANNRRKSKAHLNASSMLKKFLVVILLFKNFLAFNKSNSKVSIEGLKINAKELITLAWAYWQSHQSSDQ